MPLFLESIFHRATSGDPKTGHVPISNGPNVHSKSGPFENWTFFKSRPFYIYRKKILYKTVQAST